MLPESLEVITLGAFQNAALTSIHIPKNVTTIGNYAFYNGDDVSLETVTFAEDSKLGSIGNYAFAYNDKLASVILPDNVSQIGNDAFRYCAELEEVILPAALKTLANSSFGGSPSIKTFVMQEGLETIAASVLQTSSSEKNNKLTELVFPATVKTIGNNAFQYLTKLQTVTFAEGSQLEKLGTYVFADCASLESISLPASLKSLTTSNSSYWFNGKSVSFKMTSLFKNCTSLKFVDMSACVDLLDIHTDTFAGCSSLETLLLPPNLSVIGDFAFGNRGTNYYALTGLKEITIPASVTSVGGYAFYGCSSLETVTFEKGSQITELGVVETLSTNHVFGTYIFADTTSLKTVVLPENLTMVGIGCFENSTVENINMPSSVSAIGAKAFKNCDNIKDAGLSASLTYLGDEAFENCDKLETANLFFGLEYLGSKAFAYCKQLKSAYIPATVTSMEGNPFMGCTGVETFELDSDNVDFVVVDGVMYDKTMYTILYYPASLTAETFEFPETVHEIGVGAFAGAQLKTIVIPDRIHVITEYAFATSALESIAFHRGITTIGNNAFQGSELKSVTFERGITTIGDYAFDGCKNLNNVNLLNNIKNLGSYAFANCTSLNDFVFEDVAENDTPYILGRHFFDGCTAMTDLILPNKLTITDAEYNEFYHFYHREGCIPAYMFANTGLVNVTVPAWIKEVGNEGVFYGCKNLESITFEAVQIETDGFGKNYFYGCSKLKGFTIPTGSYMTFMNSHVFAECTALEKVTIYLDYATTDTGNYTFLNCTNLKDVQIFKVEEFAYDEAGNKIGYAKVSPGYFNYIYTAAFEGCTSLKRIPMSPNGLNFSGIAFANSGIEVLVFENLKRLNGSYNGSGAVFTGMTNLKEIWISHGTSGVTINDDAFTNLANDVNVYFYNYTYEEVVAACGGKDGWFTNADKKAHFYFKDTMPADVEWPEEIKPAT